MGASTTRTVETELPSQVERTEDGRKANNYGVLHSEHTRVFHFAPAKHAIPGCATPIDFTRAALSGLKSSWRNEAKIAVLTRTVFSIRLSRFLGSNFKVI